MAELPSAHFVYVADTGYAPYGEKPPAAIRERAHFITERLLAESPLDALVVACNTATALAIDNLRADFPALPFIGVEPGLKPGAALSTTGHVGVMATRGTVQSERYDRLRRQVEADRPQVKFHSQACDGLADAIEQGDEARTEALCRQYLEALANDIPDHAAMDVLVLGCTHYPFAIDIISGLCGDGVRILETGAPVARRAKDILQARTPRAKVDSPALTLHSTGTGERLSAAVQRWLGISVSASELRWR